MKLAMILVTVCCMSVVNAQGLMSYFSNPLALNAMGLDAGDMVEMQLYRSLMNRGNSRQNSNTPNNNYGTPANNAYAPTPGTGNNNNNRNNNRSNNRRARTNPLASYYMYQNGPDYLQDMYKMSALSRVLGNTGGGTGGNNMANMALYSALA